MEIGVLINFILAIGIGALIGLEREIVQQKEKVKDFAGIRTFIIIAIFGYLISHAAFNMLNSPGVFGIGMAAFFLLVISAYIVTAIKSKQAGATTEIVAIITFILAAILAIQYNNESRLIVVIVSVIVASLLALKENLHKFARSIKTSEVFATIKMALISVIILPLLPNKNYSLMDIPILRDFISQSSGLSSLFAQLDVFNPFKIWLIVVFISGLSFLGYILVRAFGTNKGIGISSLLGGLVSSTAVTVSLSQRSKEKPLLGPFALGIVLASSIMAVRVLIEVLVINKNLFPPMFWPLMGMFLAGLVLVFFVSVYSKEEKDDVTFNNPFTLKPALKFGLFFLFVLIASKILYIYFGNSGIYLAALLSGLADVDAITVSVSTLLLSGVIPIKTAILSIMLGVLSNMLVKIGIVFYMGDKKLAKLIAVCFGIMMVIGISIAVIL
jgi:uncharacterized membrane protein (DUF4010 family)